MYFLEQKVPKTRGFRFPPHPLKNGHAGAFLSYGVPYNKIVVFVNKNIFQDYVNFIFNFFNDKIDIIDIFHTKIFKEEKNMKITEINKNIDLSNVFSLAYVKNKKLNVSYG